ncbi:MAG TPA: toll/interleukin-1 receptor domain-containing protein [Longimicrobium sp.]|nr:toll/interleukin-1 receptor domain-containing protein [Longimicrobium sp.]
MVRRARAVCFIPARRGSPSASPFVLHASCERQIACPAFPAGLSSWSLEWSIAHGRLADLQVLSLSRHVAAESQGNARPTGRARHGTMADIFVGYASEDVDRVRPLVQLMLAQGWSVWWDPKIPIGERFYKVIERELARATCVVVVWSQSSIESDWVQNEAAEGKQRGILVPAVIDDVLIPFEFRRVETAKLHDWDSQNTSHPELQAFFSAIGGKLQRPWTPDWKDEGAGHGGGAREPEPPQAPPPPAEDAAARPARTARPAPSDQQRRATKLLAHWFAKNRIPPAVSRDARQLVERTPATAEDQRRMRLFDLCRPEDGALFARAWRALDGSPQAERAAVERLEAFLTLHLVEGELDEATYREAMATLVHEPRDEREARRHEVLTRFAENDDWDISFFAYLWKEMEEEDTAPEPPPDVALGGHGSSSPELPLVTDPAPAVGGTPGGDGEAPPVEEGGSTAFGVDADDVELPAMVIVEPVQADRGVVVVGVGEDGGTEGGWSIGPGSGSPGHGGEAVEDDTRDEISGPKTTAPPARGRTQTALAVGIAVATMAVIMAITRPWSSPGRNEEEPVVVFDPVAVDTPAVAITPAVFLDSIKAQLVLGRLQYDQGQYAAAASVFDRALGRLRSRAVELPDGDRRALEDTLTDLRSAVRTACADEETKKTRVEKGVPCPQ